MGRFSLSPAARPVDMFAPAEVRANEGAGSELLQLAGALSRFKPELQQFSSDYMANVRNTAAVEAEEDFRRMQLKSMKDFRKAVDDGEINAESNPWKASYIRQLVRREEFASAAAGVTTAYESAPIRNSDNPEEVDAWLSSQLEPFMKDLRPDELRAVGESFDRFRGGFLSEHSTRRANERQALGRMGLIAESSNLLSGDVQPAAATQKINDLVQRSLLHGFSKTEILGAVTTAISSSSDSNIEDLQQVIDGVRIDGQGLRDLVGDGALEQMKETLANNIRRAEEQKYSDQQRKIAMVRQEADSAVLAAINPKLKSGAPITREDLAAPLSSYSPEIQARILLAYKELVDAGEREASQSLLSGAVADILGGKDPNQTMVNTVSAYIAMGDADGAISAAGRLNELTRVLRSSSSVQQDNLEAYGNAYTEVLVATSTDEAVEVLKKYEGSLTEDTTFRLLQTSIERRVSAGAAEVNELYDARERSIAAVLQPAFTTIVENRDGDPVSMLDEVGFADAMRQARTGLLKARSTLPQDATLDQKIKHFDDAYSLITGPYRLKAEDATEAQAAQVAKQSQYTTEQAAKAPDGKIKDTSMFTFTKDGLAVKTGEGTFAPPLGPTKVFTSLADMTKNAPKVLDQMARSSGAPVDFQAYMQHMRREAMEYPDYDPDRFIQGMIRTALREKYDAYKQGRDEKIAQATETFDRVREWGKIIQDARQRPLVGLIKADGTRTSPGRIPERVTIDQYIEGQRALGNQVIYYTDTSTWVTFPTVKELTEATKLWSDTIDALDAEDDKILSEAK